MGRFPVDVWARWRLRRALTSIRFVTAEWIAEYLVEINDPAVASVGGDPGKAVKGKADSGKRAT